jgi:hypothetical protein
MDVTVASLETAQTPDEAGAALVRENEAAAALLKKKRKQASRKRKQQNKRQKGEEGGKRERQETPTQPDIHGNAVIRYRLKPHYHHQSKHANPHVSYYPITY